MKSKKTAGEVKPTKKQAQPARAAGNSAKDAAKNKPEAKGKVLGKKGIEVKKAGVGGRQARKQQPSPALPEFSLDVPAPSSGGQSGDFQGLSNVERADSESVDELLEEGNAFEAGIVAGVEDAEEHSDREVYTREVPEDDVPGEYLDEE